MWHRAKPPVVDLLRQSAAAIHPAPAALVMFGSVARGEAHSGSDLDVLAVRPTGVRYDDDPWTEALISWSERATSITGYPVQVMEASEAEVPSLLRRDDASVWRTIAAEGVVLAGCPLGDLTPA